jgi:hypothetical protein
MTCCMTTTITHTDDNYMHYYIGVHDGALAAHSSYVDGAHSACPSGHTQEYCMGYKAGYSDEGYLLNDA